MHTCCLAGLFCTGQETRLLWRLQRGHFVGLSTAPYSSSFCQATWSCGWTTQSPSWATRRRAPMRHAPGKMVRGLWPDTGFSMRTTLPRLHPSGVTPSSTTLAQSLANAVQKPSGSNSHLAPSQSSGPAALVAVALALCIRASAVKEGSKVAPESKGGPRSCRPPAPSHHSAPTASSRHLLHHEQHT